MADKDLESDGPSLELPSFGFGRKKKATKADPDAPVEDTAPTSAPVEAGTTEPGPAQPAVSEPGPAPAPVRSPPVEPAPVRSRPVEPAPVKTPPVEPVLSDVQPEPAPRRTFSLPAIPGLQAALVVGLAVGLLAVLLTFGSLKLCEVVRGTDACGGPGLLLLVATLVVLTYAGSWLLRAFGIDDPGSTSFLAVGLLTVVTMLLFLDVIYDWWMVIVVPVVSMASYALAWWTTTRLVDVDQL